MYCVIYSAGKDPFTAYHFIHSSQENTNGVVIDKDATEWKKRTP